MANGISTGTAGEGDAGGSCEAYGDSGMVSPVLFVVPVPQYQVYPRPS